MIGEDLHRSPLLNAARRAGERVCWLAELIANYDDADPDQRAVLVEQNLDLGRFLAAADARWEYERDEARADVAGAIILEELGAYL